MSGRKTLCGIGCALTCLGALYAFQRPFYQLRGVEYRAFELPEDWQQKGEWAFARLMFPGGPNDGYRGRFDGDFRLGLSLWTQDYPRADRHFVLALRRLTRLHVRSVEQPVNLDEGGVGDWPWLYAVQTGHWQLTDSQAKSLREYLLRGGFFMADDFWGTPEWAVFWDSMGRVFPDRQAVELESNNTIFHTIYDLDDRYQVPGAWGLYGRGYQNDGRVAHWKGILDDKGRLMVAITMNSDLGDSWEWADAPEYPERYSALGIRIGVNYVTYAMTH
jgi:Domain of unknown function (DUF4159)